MTNNDSVQPTTQPVEFFADKLLQINRQSPIFLLLTKDTFSSLNSNIATFHHSFIILQFSHSLFQSDKIDKIILIISFIQI